MPLWLLTFPLYIEIIPSEHSNLGGHMMALRLLINLIAFGVLFSSTCHASSAWSPLGPDGGDQFKVVISPSNPNTLFALGHHSVHRSLNAGYSWTALHNNEMAGGTFLAMVIQSDNENNIFLANTISGVWYSQDNGDTWVDRSNGLPEISGFDNVYYPVASLARTADGRLYAGLSESDKFDRPEGWIYRSDSDGLSWIRDDEGIQVGNSGQGQLTSVLLNVDNEGSLWAMIYGGGVYLYEAGDWEARNANLPAEALKCTYLEFDPQDANRLLLGTESSWIYETVDKGQTWNRLSLPESLSGLNPLPLVYTLAMDPNNTQFIWVDAKDYNGSIEQPIFKPLPAQTFGAGGFLSINGGDGWVGISPRVMRISIDTREVVENKLFPLGHVKRSRVWYSTSGGVGSLNKSDDGLISSALATNGIRSILFNNIWLHPSPPEPTNQTLFAAAESGLYLKDGDNDWEYLPPTEHSIYTWSFNADYSDLNFIYYGTGNPAWSFPEDRGIYRIGFDCFGGECPPGDQILENVGVWRVVTTPLEPRTIYAATQEEGILVSYDHGNSWKEFNNGLTLPQSITDIELDENGVPMYAAARTRSGNLNADPPQPWSPSGDEEGAVYYYDKDAETWQSISDMPYAVLDLERVDGQPDTLYAATVLGLFKTSDQGSTWEPILPSKLVYDFLIDSNNQNYMYAATSDGVFRSTNGGNQWHDFSEGLRYYNVQSIALDPTTGSLYAGTGGNSVYRRQPDADAQPSLSIAPSPLNMGVVIMGLSHQEDIVITNVGEADLLITAITPYHQTFTLIDPMLPISVSPKTEHTLTVSFTPFMPGKINSRLNFASNDPINPVFEYPVSGEGQEGTQPVLLIRANGRSGSVTVRHQTIVFVTVMLSPNDFLDVFSEWWLRATTPFGTYWLVYGSGWQASQTPLLCRSGPMVEISDPIIVSQRILPYGEYEFEFILDNIINGTLDYSWVDAVTIIAE